MAETTRALTYDELLFEYQRVSQELAQLRRLIFGQKRERFVPVVNEQQLAIALPGDIPTTTAVTPTQTISYTRRQNKASTPTPPVRKPWPAHLRREEIRLEPKEDVSALTKMGEEKTEELEYIPAELYVKVYLRPKYAKPNGEGIVIAELPARPIEKGSAGPGLIAHMIISKYVDHLPLYRQLQQFRRDKVEIAESTASGWMKASSEAIVPLHDLQRTTIQQSSYLMVDETPIPVLDQTKPGKTHLGYYWVYYDPIAKLVYFDYRPSRSRAGPNEMFKNFHGYLQCDGHTGYEDILVRAEVVGVGCFAHARRYFEQAQDSDREHAEWMLMKLQVLYRLEREAREANMSFEERHVHRQQHALSILQEIHAWLKQNSSIPSVNPSFIFRLGFVNLAASKRRRDGTTPP